MSARFVASAPTPEGLPTTGLPEAAFIGRSNVGKSSLLGRIIKQPKLVRTSRTPGRTQLLNLFVFEERLALVDLPGYGYAKLSKTKRQALGRLIHAYITEREGLLGVVQIFDARRDKVTDEDRQLTELVLQSERRLLVALTKIDLVPKNRRLHCVRRIEQDLGIPPGFAVACSAKSGQGRAEIVTRLMELKDG
ncbi:MAG: ribosome biogenesis GTP-binding protein YihA/YsxC [Myxococcota bacterium]